jgi:DnaK suppressor protein
MNIHIYKERLEEMLKDVTKELQTIGIQNPQNAQDWVTTADPAEHTSADQNVLADAHEDVQERDSLLTELETDYNAIVHALHMIECGTFGICEICNAPIESQRLDVYPIARTCIAHMHNTHTT